MGDLDTAHLYELLADDLRRSFRRQGVSEQDAEDMTQEVFLRVHRSRSSPVASTHPVAWIRSIARNVRIDAARRSRVRPVLAETAESEAAADAEEDRFGALANGWLRSAIRALPAEDAAVLERSELDGRPHREIAAELGLSLSAVKSRVSRGRAKLRAALFDCCRVEFDRRGGVVDVERRGSSCDDDGCADRC